MNRLNEHDGEAQASTRNSTRDVENQPDQLDQAVMDSLIKRAEAVAAQQQHQDDHQPDRLDDDSAVMDSLIKRAEAEAAQQYQDDAHQYRDEESDPKKAQVTDKASTTTHTRSKKEAKSEDDEATRKIMEIVVEQAGLANDKRVKQVNRARPAGAHDQENTLEVTTETPGLQQQMQITENQVPPLVVLMTKQIRSKRPHLSVPPSNNSGNKSWCPEPTPWQGREIRI
ncbi:expressed unknown protein [Seminavis robusta]|uniref:Uncharacterized protein n=1 Tax=Seminavis robusta TaxID=568900 RepID=A0A9N8E070_9STRA|nr:expressed unknown protein [Seminavis robusta]|eukprot:Sro406_g136380.1 n/a (227) ;mRNA; r:30370-31195